MCALYTAVLIVLYYIVLYVVAVLAVLYYIVLYVVPVCCTTAKPILTIVPKVRDGSCVCQRACLLYSPSYKLYTSSNCTVQWTP